MEPACVARVSDHKALHREHIKTLTLKQMLQRLPIALAQAIAGKLFEDLLNETRQNINFSYREKSY